MSNNEPPPRPDGVPGQGQPDQPAGSAGAPRYPAAPQPQAGQPSAPVAQQPPSIRTAVRLMWAGAAISLLSMIVTLATSGSLKTQIRDQLDKSGQQVTQTTLNAAYAFAIAFAVVGALIAIGLWLWMAWKNGQGRGWARIVATVLAGINLLTTIYSVASGNTTPVATIITVVNLLLAIVIVVLLWRKESNAYYAASSGRPQQTY